MGIVLTILLSTHETFQKYKWKTSVFSTSLSRKRTLHTCPVLTNYHGVCECSKVSKERAGYISIVNHPSAGVSSSAVRGHALRGWWCGRTYSSFLFICSLHSGSGLVPQTCWVTNLKPTIETISQSKKRQRSWLAKHIVWGHLETLWRKKSICIVEAVIHPIYRHKPMWFVFFSWHLKVLSLSQWLLHYIPSLCHLLYIRFFLFFFWLHAIAWILLICYCLKSGAI